MVDMTKNTTEKKLTQSDIRGVFIRSNLFQLDHVTICDPLLII